MKVLTLTQPWATLVACGAKRIETRSWSTPYRGRLFIHAAAGLAPVGGKRGLRELVNSQPFYSALVDLFDHTASKSLIDTILDGLPYGKIIAVCNLHDCVSTSEIHPRWWREYYGGRRWEMTDQEWAFGDYSREPKPRWGWLLDGIQPLATPVPCKGMLGLWEPDTLTHATVTRELIKMVQP